MDVRCAIVLICGSYLLSPALAVFWDSDQTTFRCAARLDVCVLKNVTLESEHTISTSKFTDIRDPLIVESGNVPNFSRELAQKLHNVADLTLDRLGIVQMHVRPSFVHLSAVGNAINKLLVEDANAGPYSLLTLKLSHNKLTELPPVERFVRLMNLTLDNNLLTTVDMGAFAKLTELRALSLANNALLTVSSPDNTPLYLLKLRQLSFGGNQLAMVNVRTWEFASLNELNLTSNSLTWLEGPLAQFPSLKSLSLAGNRWHCEWLMALYAHQETAPQLELDSDEQQQCRNQHMMLSRQHCCNPAGEDGFGIIDVFGDKWNELKRLSAMLDALNNTIMHGSASVKPLLESQHAALGKRLDNLLEKQNQHSDQLKTLDWTLSQQNRKLHTVEEELSNQVEKLHHVVNARWNHTMERPTEYRESDAANASISKDWTVVAAQHEHTLTGLRKQIDSTINQFNVHAKKAYEHGAILKNHTSRLDSMKDALDDVRQAGTQLERRVQEIETKTNFIARFLKDLAERGVEEIE